MKPTQRHTLANFFIASWGIEDRLQQAQIRQAASEEPLRMHRILMLSEYLYPECERRKLSRATVENGATTQALIALGAAGIELVESVLMDIFISAAPREVFDLRGETAEPQATARILYKILARRHEVGHRMAMLPNPLRRDLSPIDDLDIRLARSLTTLFSDADDIDISGLITVAAVDGSDLVRLAAVRAAAAFVGFAKVREALENVVDDTCDKVRAAALEALAPFVDRREVAESIVWFSDDPAPEIRLRALRLILEECPHRLHEDRLPELAFDPVEEIAAVARAHFSADELRRYVTRLADLAMDEGLLQPSYLRILGSSPLVPSAMRDRAFLAQLRQLRQRHHPADRLVDLLEALRPWEQEVGVELRREIDAALAEATDLSLGPVKRRKAEGEGSRSGSPN